jgi:hypothetical protein
MKLKIESILGLTPPNQEYLLLDVVEDTNLGEYMVINTLRTSDGIDLIRNRHIYQFPSREVKKGEKVLLYSTKGKDGIQVNVILERRHIFFWNLTKRMWRKHIGKVYLIHIDSWESKML